jgi:chitodextrinase
VQAGGDLADGGAVIAALSERRECCVERGAVEIVGEVPRTGTPDARLAEPERLYARKYEGADVMYHTGHHAWLRLVPDKITSWDFRKKVSVEDYDFG